MSRPVHFQRRNHLAFADDKLPIQPKLNRAVRIPTEQFKLMRFSVCRIIKRFHQLRTASVFVMLFVTVIGMPHIAVGSGGNESGFSDVIAVLALRET